MQISNTDIRNCQLNANFTLNIGTLILNYLQTAFLIGEIDAAEGEDTLRLFAEGLKNDSNWFYAQHSNDAGIRP